MKLRLAFVITGIIVGFSGIIFRLHYLQIAQGSYYSAKAESQYTSSGVLEPHRGSLYFTDKHENVIPVVVNKDYDVVFAVPKEIKDPKKAAIALAKIFNLNADRLAVRLARKNDLYEHIANKISKEDVEAVRAADIKGIYFDKETLRFYPFEQLASHVLGFLGFSEDDMEPMGKYGLEAYYDVELRGKRGTIEGEKITAPVHGGDFYLTIDRNIQARAEEMLDDLTARYHTNAGTIIVQDPSTGAILALANRPTFDPNSYGDASLSDFLNPAIQSVYEPGSVFKVLTMAAGIDTGKITPKTTFYDSGSLTLNGKKIMNWDGRAHGTVTMTEVIEESINTGAAFAEQKTGHKVFESYLRLFGFEEKTDIELLGEVPGSLGNIGKKGQDINFATASYGQGVSVTPLQLIDAISAIANGGLLMHPYLSRENGPHVVRRVISRETASAVTDMMVSAVKKAKVASISEYHIAGKTGTAQVPDFKRGGYSEDFIHTYVGFAPATNPRFTALIKLDKPKGATLAGATVVPAFRELAQFILSYYNIPPDNLVHVGE
ncbi:MAG: penicillin-binding protein 2 [Patescibacteria group bacterium]|mgnify:CR=1 FL=1